MATLRCNDQEWSFERNLSVHTPHSYPGIGLSSNSARVKLRARVARETSSLCNHGWSFHHLGPTIDKRSIALLGVEVPQPKVGFVYAPLQEDDPNLVKLLDDDRMWTRHQKEIHAALRQAFNDEWETIERHTFDTSPE